VTALDPRLDEIQARLNAATQGVIEFTEYSRRGGRIYTDTPKRQLIADLYGTGNPQFYANARDYVSYLLAELRKAHEALAAGLELADKWAALGPEDDWAEGGMADTVLADAGRAFRAAVAAAKGDERG
jgi:hypothetical protein